MAMKRTFGRSTTPKRTLGKPSPPKPPAPPLPKASPKPPPETEATLPPVDQARELVRQAWTVTGDRLSYEDLRTRLTALKLQKNDFYALRDAIPVTATGPVGDQARAVNRILKGLQAQA